MKVVCITERFCISIPPGPPVLSEGGEETKRENERLILDLSDPASPPAFPFPSQFMWSRQDGVELVNVTDTRVFSYPIIDIGSVLSSDSGLYTLSATNYQLDGVTPVGSDTASFTLNVLCESCDERDTSQHLVPQSQHMLVCVNVHVHTCVGPVVVGWHCVFCKR